MDAQDFERFVHTAAKIDAPSEVVAQLFGRLARNGTVGVGEMATRIRGGATRSKETVQTLKQHPSECITQYRQTKVGKPTRKIGERPSLVAVPASSPEEWSMQGWTLGRDGTPRGRLVRTAFSRQDAHTEGDFLDRLDPRFVSESERFNPGVMPSPRHPILNQKSMKREEKNNSRIQRYVAHRHHTDEILAPDRAGTIQQERRCGWLVEQRMGYLTALAQSQDVRIQRMAERAEKKL